MKITKFKKTFINFTVVITIFCGVTWIDYYHAISAKRPLFNYTAAIYQDGGSEKMDGLFYAVTDMNRISLRPIEGETYRHQTKVGYTYDYAFLPIDFDHTEQIEGELTTLKGPK